MTAEPTPLDSAVNNRLVTARLTQRLSQNHAGPNPRSFGHFGTGGALGFGDPDAGIAFGYVMNHVIPRWQSSRNRALIDAVYRSL